MSLLILWRLVPAYHVSKAIGYANRKQFYKLIQSWSKLAPDSEYEIVKEIWTIWSKYLPNRNYFVHLNVSFFANER